MLAYHRVIITASDDHQSWQTDVLHTRCLMGQPYLDHFLWKVQDQTGQQHLVMVLHWPFRICKVSHSSISHLQAFHMYLSLHPCYSLAYSFHLLSFGVVYDYVGSLFWSILYSKGPNLENAEFKKIINFLNLGGFYSWLWPWLCSWSNYSADETWSLCLQELWQETKGEMQQDLNLKQKLYSASRPYSCQEVADIL